MTQGRFAGRGQNAGCDGCGQVNGQGNGRGSGTGYTSKQKTAKVGLCKELESHIFDYGVVNAADLMRTTQEKISQYVGVKYGYGEDISNELTNKTTVVVAPPVYSAAIVQRHLEWEAHVRKKQRKTKVALDSKLRQLMSVDPANREVIVIAEVENLIEDIDYQQGQEVPYTTALEFGYMMLTRQSTPRTGLTSNPSLIARVSSGPSPSYVRRSYTWI